MDEQSIFLEALQKQSPEERAAFLAEACGDEEGVRHEIEMLLKAHHKVGNFLQGAPLGIEHTVDQPINEKPNAQIGPYKLLQQIGEGGMGVVYLAEQKEPVKRRVALKIIKPGMDTRQVIARFEAERQALAMMDHPNIAKVLDAGATESGRPYFVMELVNGLPVTKYCDEQQLTPKERLELFVPICQAVQHAHQKGIIHRDLKPSNILVAMYDSKAVPKIIDFGVAKATSQTLTEKTMFTQVGQVVGTLEYMSPEQAQRNQLDIDTRSDIYSLGVVLYELLTGETPFDRERLRSAAFDEMLRIIREEEPSKPSTKVSSSQSLPSIAANRRIEPAKLGSLIRGELDWIVLKAMEKDRARRYETASKFADDLQHYLNDEAVVACPPSAAYHFRRFARRNRAKLYVGGMLATTVLMIVASLGWAVRDRAAWKAENVRQRQKREVEVIREREARLERTRNQVEFILSDVDRFSQEQRWDEALAAAERAEAIVASGEVESPVKERVSVTLQELRFVTRLSEILLELSDFRMESSDLQTWRFDFSGAAESYVEAFQRFGVNLDSSSTGALVVQLKQHPRITGPVADALCELAFCRRQKEPSLRRSEWVPLVEAAMAIDSDSMNKQLRKLCIRDDWSEHQDQLISLMESFNPGLHSAQSALYLARALNDAELPELAVNVLRASQHHAPGDFWANYNLGLLLLRQKDYAEAVRFCSVALGIEPGSLVVRDVLGNALYMQGQHEEAIACYQKAIEIDEHFALAHYNLGVVLAERGRIDEAITSYQKAIEIDENLTDAHNNLGIIQARQGKHQDAVENFRRAIEIDDNFAKAHANLGTALGDQGKLAEAIASYQKAIEIDENYVNAHACLGSVLAEQGKDEEAIASYRRAIEIDQNYVMAHTNLGVILAEQGKHEEAIACYRRAIEIDQNHANAHNNLGVVLAELGKDEEAIARYRRAIEIDQNHAGARNNLADLCTILGWRLATAADVTKRDPARAIELANLTVELRPDIAKNWSNLGVAQYQMGNWRASLEALSRADAMRQPGDLEHRMFLAMAHWQLGDHDKARELYAEGAAWMAKRQNNNAELIRFRAEAEKLMGITEEERQFVIDR